MSHDNDVKMGFNDTNKGNKAKFRIHFFFFVQNLMSKKCAKMEIIDFLCGTRMKSEMSE